jgi:hypothetical protein
MNGRLLTNAIAIASVLALGSVAATPAAAAVSVPVVGSVDGGGSFVGTFTLQKFAVKDGALVAVGTVTGTLTDAVGTATGILKTVSMPATASASCEILHLELGPIDLDLLGLKVHLDKVVLDISAEPGSGNLLGNLLCAVAGLLDLGGLSKLLNQILSLLG